jgi:hypothetical protein
VGKTTLAAQLLRRVMERGPARVVAVATGELTIDDLFSTITSALCHRLLIEGVSGNPLRAVEMRASVVGSDPWVGPPHKKMSMATRVLPATVGGVQVLVEAEVPPGPSSLRLVLS